MLKETYQRLDDYASRYNAVCVAYSDGKDSRCVMDLCLRKFKRVEAYYMQLVPGLEIVETMLAQAERMWGVKIHRYPHPTVSDALREGRFCHPNWKTSDVPHVKLSHIYAIAMSDTNTRLIATGQKKADSRARARLLKYSKRTDIFHPIQDWNRFDVITYLKEHGIPEPLQGNTVGWGISLDTEGILWLYDHFPRDYEKIAEYFPFVEAIVWRRTFYGVTS